ncbi:MAG: DUF1634 domain-containing protein [Prevotellaceae bacterium]|nr:DUF1634 domain-containing protein [Prevotellaceae bacterium]
MSLQILIARTLRTGVAVACIVSAIGGVIYLCQHGLEPMPDYSRFSYADAPLHPEYTTLGGIFSAAAAGRAVGFIGIGVLCLLLTPIMRVVLSLADFVYQRDWLYAAITAVVLAVILYNSFFP